MLPFQLELEPCRRFVMKNGSSHVNLAGLHRMLEVVAVVVFWADARLHVHVLGHELILVHVLVLVGVLVGAEMIRIVGLFALHHSDVVGLHLVFQLLLAERASGCVPCIIKFRQLCRKLACGLLLGHLAVSCSHLVVQ